MLKVDKCLSVVTSLQLKISLAFLADFTDQSPDFGNLKDEEFWAFVCFAVTGIPLLLFGIKRASNKNL